MNALEIFGVYRKNWPTCGMLHTVFVKPCIQIAALKAIGLCISFCQSLPLSMCGKWHKLHKYIQQKDKVVT